MSQNLEALLLQQRLVDEVGWGRIETELEVHNSQVVGFTIFGKQRNLYNRTAADENDNQRAVNDIATRLAQQLKTVKKGTLTYSIDSVGDKIKSVTWLSKIHKKLDKQ